MDFSANLRELGVNIDANLYRNAVAFVELQSAVFLFFPSAFFNKVGRLSLIAIMVSAVYGHVVVKHSQEDIIQSCFILFLLLLLHYLATEGKVEEKEE